jgi:hypothetical protein
MNTQISKRILLACGALVVLALTAAPANATITWSATNNQYTNVNIASDTSANTINGQVGNTGFGVTFQNMIGPNGVTQVQMNGRNGVAFIQSEHDNQNPAANDMTGFTSLTVMAQAGTGWTAGSFFLDLIKNAVAGTVTLSGMDQFGGTTTNTFAISGTGQNAYSFDTANGEVVTKFTVSVPTASALGDFRAFSVNAVTVPTPNNVPDGGSTIMLLGAALGGLGAMRRFVRR